MKSKPEKLQNGKLQLAPNWTSMWDTTPVPVAGWHGLKQMLNLSPTLHSHQAEEMDEMPVRG